MCSDHKKSHIRHESDLIASKSPLKGSKYIFISSFDVLVIWYIGNDLPLYSEPGELLVIKVAETGSS